MCALTQNRILTFGREKGFFQNFRLEGQGSMNFDPYSRIVVRRRLIGAHTLGREKGFFQNFRLEGQGSRQDSGEDYDGEFHQVFATCLIVQGELIPIKSRNPVKQNKLFPLRSDAGSHVRGCVSRGTTLLLLYYSPV